MKKFILLVCIFLSIQVSLGTGISGDVTIMLDPSGDAQHTGRIIEDSFERALTLKFAELIKKKLEHDNPNIKIILSRFAGETLEPYQNVSFANRLDVDLFININLFQDDKQVNEINIYNLMYNKTYDLWPRKFDKLFLCPLEDAYLVNIDKSLNYAKTFAQYLCGLTKKSFNCFGPFGIPFKHLVGLKQPAFALEIGISKKEDITNLVEPIVNAIQHIILKIS